MNAIKLKILSSGRSSRNGMVCKFFMPIEFGGSLRLSLVQIKLHGTKKIMKRLNALDKV